MRRPREPERHRFRNERAYQKAVQRYIRQMDEWHTQEAIRERNERQRSEWKSGGSVDGQPATTRQQGSRTEALWGGSVGNTPGDSHGHIVSNDGVNADYLRLPGGEVVVDNQIDDPYEGRSEPKH